MPDDVAWLREYVQALSSEPILTNGEQLELARSARAGEAWATAALLRSQQRLVVSIALRYAPDREPQSLAPLVRLAHGALGPAIESFDPDKGHSLSEHTTWWIRRALTPPDAQERTTSTRG